MAGWMACWVGAAFIIGVGGCKKEQTPEKGQGDVKAQVAAKLARADGVDGTVDKVVSKCAGCSLHMDGKPEFSIRVAGYEMDFCGEDCKKTFEEDPNKAILALKIDEK